MKFFHALFRAGLLGDPQAAIPRLHLLALRFAVAAFFFHAFQAMFTPGSGHAWARLAGNAAGAQPETMFGWYRPFAEAVILANTPLATDLTMWASLALCVSLALGLLARFATLLGMVLMLNLMLLAGSTPLTVNTQGLVFWSLLTLFLTAPGRVLGVDAWLHKRVPASWIA